METRLEMTEREQGITNLPTLERVLKGDIRITANPDLIDKLCSLFPDLAIFRQSDRSMLPTAEAKPVDRITKLLNAEVIDRRQARACMRYRHCRDVFMAGFTAKAIDLTKERVDGGGAYDDGLYEKTVMDCYRLILREVPLGQLRWLEDVAGSDMSIKQARNKNGGDRNDATQAFLQSVNALESALLKFDS